MLTYDGNDHENYDLIYNGEIIAEVSLGEDACMHLVSKINECIAPYDKQGCTAEVSIDGGKLGLIVDVWQNEGVLLNTFTFWFEDYEE